MYIIVHTCTSSSSSLHVRVYIVELELYLYDVYYHGATLHGVTLDMLRHPTPRVTDSITRTYKCVGITPYLYYGVITELLRTRTKDLSSYLVRCTYVHMYLVLSGISYKVSYKVRGT